MNTTSNYPSKKKNFRFIVITPRHIFIFACALIAFGYVLMSGPGSTELPFNPDIFSVRRIVIAPLLCLTGYLLIIIGILRKNRLKP